MKYVSLVIGILLCLCIGCHRKGSTEAIAANCLYLWQIASQQRTPHPLFIERCCELGSTYKKDVAGCVNKTYKLKHNRYY